MSEIDEIIEDYDGPVVSYVPRPFERLCSKVAQIGYFVSNLEKTTGVAHQICLSASDLETLLCEIHTCAKIAADELARARKEYDEATK